MSNNTFLRNKKTRIAFILALTLLLQVFMPIMKVNAANTYTSAAEYKGQISNNDIVHSGDSFVAYNIDKSNYDTVSSTTWLYVQIIGGSNETPGSTFTVPDDRQYVFLNIRFHYENDATGCFDQPSLMLTGLNKVTFDYNGGSEQLSSALIRYNSTYGTMVNYGALKYTSDYQVGGLPTPSRDGYTFDGWYTAAEGGTKVTDNTTFNGTSDITLYAHWTSNHIHVFTYSVGTGDEANKITATCTNTESDCPLNDGNGNHTISLTINKPALTAYGGTESASATLTNLDAFKTATGLTNVETNIKYEGRDGTNYDKSTTAPTAVGKYTASITLSNVAVSGGGTGNVTAKVDYEISKRELTIKADDKSINYGEDEPTLTATVSGFAAGDTIDSTGLTYSLTRATGNGAGTYTITPSGASGNAQLLNNYSFKYETGTFTIKGISITIKAADRTITYGETIPSDVSKVSVTSGALSNGHTISSIKYTASSTNVTTNGTVTPSMAVIKDTDGAGADVTDNYTITYVPGVLRINKADPVYTVNPSAKSDLYYNGNIWTLINEGRTNDGTIKYKVEAIGSEPGAAVPQSGFGETNFSDTLPYATEVGTYKVTYYIVGDSNHNDSAESTLNVTIVPDAPPVISGATNGASYGGGTTINLSVSDISGLASVTINGESKPVTGNTYTQTISGAGSYTITATDTAGNTSTLSFTIKSGDSGGSGGSGDSGGSGGSGGDSSGGGGSNNPSGNTPSSDNGNKPTDNNVPSNNPENSQPSDTARNNKKTSDSKSNNQTSNNGQDDESIDDKDSEGSTTNDKEDVTTNVTNDDFNRIFFNEERTISYGDGKVIVSVDVEDEGGTKTDYSGSIVGDAESIVKAVLSQDDIDAVANGETVWIKLVVTLISEDVPQTDKEQIEAALTTIADQELIPGTYYDLKVMKSVGGGDWEKLTTLNDDIEITLDIDEGLQADGRTFYILRSHEGAVTMLFDLDEEPNTITISSRYFSTYALVYTDSPDMAEPVSEKHNCLMHWFILAAALIGEILALLLRRHEDKKKLLIGTECVDIVIMFALAIIGSCMWDWIIFAIGTAAIVLTVFLPHES